MPKMILIRGLPGSGKSTLAKKIKNDYTGPLWCHHWEADMFFMEDGEYHFNPTKIKMAHDWCKWKVEEDMKEGNDVIISNTFTQHWEMDVYLVLADKYGYDVEVFTCTGNYGNIHGVPEETIEKMRNRWED